MANNTPIVGIGDSFSYGTGSPATYTAVNGVKSVAQGGDKSAMQDTTTMATPNGVKTVIPSVIDPGTYDVKLDFYAADVTQVALENFRNNGTLVSFKVGYGSSNTTTFLGYVESFTPGWTLEKTASLDVKIQVSGPVTRS